MNHTYAHTPLQTNDFNVIIWINSPPCFCPILEPVPVNMKDVVPDIKELLRGACCRLGSSEGEHLAQIWGGMNQGKFPRQQSLSWIVKGLTPE